MIRSTIGQPTLLQFESLASDGGIVHAVSTRLGGVSQSHFATLNVSTSGGDDPNSVDENRRRILNALGLDASELATMGQVHGIRCAVITQRTMAGRRPFMPHTDAMVTNVPGTPLMVLCADCAGILLWDPEHRAVGVVHAGWRGILGRVTAAAVQAMTREYGTRPGMLRAAIGPAIGPCCFEVRELVLAPLGATVPDADRFVRLSQEGKTFLDLPALLRSQLQSLGVPCDRIETSTICTACHTELLYSHRAEEGRTGRFGAFIALRGEASAQ